jgi:hypothetical protein
MQRELHTLGTPHQFDPLQTAMVSCSANAPLSTTHHCISLGTASCQHSRSPTLIRCACTKCRFHFIPCGSKSSLNYLPLCFHCGQRLFQGLGEQPQYTYQGNQSVAHHFPPPGIAQHPFDLPIIPGPLRPVHYAPLARVCIFSPSACCSHSPSDQIRSRRC